MIASPAFRYTPLRDPPDEEPADAGDTAAIETRPGSALTDLEHALIGMVACIYIMTPGDQAHPVVKSVAAGSIRDYARNCLQWIVSAREHRSTELIWLIDSEETMSAAAELLRNDIETFGGESVFSHYPPQETLPDQDSELDQYLAGR